MPEHQTEPAFLRCKVLHGVGMTTLLRHRSKVSTVCVPGEEETGSRVLP